MARRLRGEPLQYVLGQWSFRTLDLRIDRRVLIPRPETEVVVEVALAEWDDLGGGLAVDLGCGSGAIALSLAAERPGRSVWATDVSADALAVAATNLELLAASVDATTHPGQAAATHSPAEAVQLVRGAWWSALPAELRGQVSLVVSNPPYIAEHELASLESQVKDWEPVGALVAGPTGLEAVAAILGDAPSWLARPAAAVVEIAPHQAASAALLARAAGFSTVQVRPDLTGRDRVLVGRIEP